MFGLASGLRTPNNFWASGFKVCGVLDEAGLGTYLEGSRESTGRLKNNCTFPGVRGLGHLGAALCSFVVDSRPRAPKP